MMQNSLSQFWEADIITNPIINSKENDWFMLALISVISSKF